MGRLKIVAAIVFGYIIGLLTTSMNQTTSFLTAFTSTPSSLISSPVAITTGDVTKNGAVAPPDYTEGWKDIHLFVGDRKNSTIVQDPPGRWGYGAQWGQDKVILSLLHEKQGGYFIDLAANHGKILSNTYQLEEQKGWNGLCIEANERYWDSHISRTCKLISAVVSGNKMDYVQFRTHDGNLAPSGGIVGDDFNHVPGTVRKNFMTKSYFTVTLLEIFQRFQVPKMIDYFSLDVEGAELVVMESFPFDIYTVRVFTIERPKQALIDLLYQNEYVYLATFQTKNEDETLFVHKSVLPDLNRTVIEGMKTSDTSMLGNVAGDKPISKKG